MVDSERMKQQPVRWRRNFLLCSLNVIPKTAVKSLTVR
jgi:hypothetical protein